MYQIFHFCKESCRNLSHLSSSKYITPCQDKLNLIQEVMGSVFWLHTMCLTKCVTHFCISLNQASLFVPLDFCFSFHLVISFFSHVHLDALLAILLFTEIWNQEILFVLVNLFFCFKIVANLRTNWYSYFRLS